MYSKFPPYYIFHPHCWQIQSFNIFKASFRKIRAFFILVFSFVPPLTRFCILRSSLHQNACEFKKKKKGGGWLLHTYVLIKFIKTHSRYCELLEIYSLAHAIFQYLERDSTSAKTQRKCWPHCFKNEYRFDSKFSGIFRIWRTFQVYEA